MKTFYSPAFMGHFGCLTDVPNDYATCFKSFIMTRKI